MMQVHEKIGNYSNITCKSIGVSRFCLLLGVSPELPGLEELLATNLTSSSNDFWHA